MRDIYQTGKQMAMFDEPRIRQLVLFSDDAPAPVATPEPADIELSEFHVVAIKGYHLANWPVETVATMFGVTIDRVREAMNTPTSLDDGGPSDAELDALFGPRSRPRSVTPDASHGIEASIESTSTANALNVR